MSNEHDGHIAMKLYTSDFPSSTSLLHAFMNPEALKGQNKNGLMFIWGDSELISMVITGSSASSDIDAHSYNVTAFSD